MPLKLRLLLFYLNHIAKQLDYSKLDAPTVREINHKEYEKVSSIIDFAALPLFKTWDEEVRVRDGANIAVRIYQATEKKNVPLIVFFHGGGFVTRSIETHDKACRRIAQTNEAVVISVGYRLAPEFKFPIPVFDCYDATVWAAQQASRLGTDPQKLVVMGDSAGGNLATVVSILARDGDGPSIRAQVLIYPTADGRLQHATIDQFAKGYLLTKPMMKWFLQHYQRSAEDVVDPLMSPILTDNLGGLPPTYISTAEYDPLKGEGTDYAASLKEAGNEVFVKDYKGVIHGFLNMAKITTKQTFAMHEDIKQFLSANL